MELSKQTWPVGQIAYGTYDWLRREIGSTCGFGADFNTWNHERQGLVDSCIQSGLKRFYFPPPASQTEQRHQWSFLMPTVTVTTASAIPTYDLPANFSGALEGFTLSGQFRITMIREVDLRVLRAKEDAAEGKPRFAAIRPRVVDGVGHQQWELELYPSPDGIYSLNYAYQINPGSIDENNQAPYGGSEHAETILEACLAIMEERHPMIINSASLHRTAFMERLQGSIVLDQQLKLTNGLAWEIVEPAYGTYDYFAREIGGFLGYGFSPDGWSYDQDRRVSSLVQSGFRQFYFPPLIGGDTQMADAYDWTFLKPRATLSLEKDSYDYDLPSDFGLVLEGVTYDENGKQFRIEVVGEAMLRSQRANASLQGAPKYCAVRPKTSDYTSAQSYEIVFYPTPDDFYSLEYVYKVNPPDASPANLHPLGTRAHAETILASCLSVAELFRDNARGPHHERFLERLSASIALDMKVKGTARA